MVEYKLRLDLSSVLWGHSHGGGEAMKGSEDQHFREAATVFLSQTEGIDGLTSLCHSG